MLIAFVEISLISVVHTEYMQVKKSKYAGTFNMITVTGYAGAADLYAMQHGIGAEPNDTFESTDDTMILGRISKAGKVYLDVVPHQSDPTEDFNFETTYPSAMGNIV